MSYLGINHETGAALNYVEALRPSHIDVSEFAIDPLLGTGQQVMMVVKRTNQGERDGFIRKQMEKTGADAVTVIRSDTHSNRYYDGVVTTTDLGVDRLDTANSERSRVFSQPTAAAYDAPNDEILVGAANEIYRVSADLETIMSSRHPWFGRLHTIDLIPGGRDALITSASMDMVHFVNQDTQALVGEFSFWDRFPCYNAKGQLVLREGVTPDFKVDEPDDNILRVSPDGLGLHHSRLPLHINSAIMGACRELIFTAFKTGKLYGYNLNTGDLRNLIIGMGAPHSVLRRPNGLVVTDTTGESLIELREDYSLEASYNFSELPGKKPGLEAERWLQSVVPLVGNLLAAVDSPRGAVHLIDTESRTRRSISCDPNWAVQTVLSYS